MPITLCAAQTAVHQFSCKECYCRLLSVQFIMQVRVMKSLNIGALIVKDNEGHVAGMVTSDQLTSVL